MSLSVSTPGENAQASVLDCQGMGSAPRRRTGCRPYSSAQAIRMISLTKRACTFAVACALTVLTVSLGRGENPGDPAAVSSQDGKYVDKEGNPTYKVDKDGKVDFYSYI